MRDQISHIADHYRLIQSKACAILEQADGTGCFINDPWSKDIGEGITSVLKGGKYIEKAAVNFSVVEGDFHKDMAVYAGRKGRRFVATGVSSIIHPVNPLAPIIHFNIRYFQLNNGQSWFGGGMDLTPHYIDKSEAKEFHQTLKAACDEFDPAFYDSFKKQADDYFFLDHRNETRGVGGIFFDQQSPTEEVTLETLLSFTLKLGELYPEIYAKLLSKKCNLPYTEEHEQWQRLRRSRYVEFNLIQDRGTKFGLASGGNTESILVSMPPNASWEYKYTPKEGSLEWKTQQLLIKGVDWINI